MTGLTIRPARPQDAEALRACAVAAYARHAATMGQKPAPMLADYPALIAAGQVWVAQDGAGALPGFIVFYPQGPDMMLENVAVWPAQAGRGIGRALIAWCEAAARDAGLAGVVLYTNIKMADNLQLYPRLGYAETGRRVENGFHRVWFRKPLPPR